MPLMENVVGRNATQNPRCPHFFRGSAKVVNCYGCHFEQELSQNITQVKPGQPHQYVTDHQEVDLWAFEEC